ncbi:MAG: dephospho-CoA kinase [Prevotella sp.]|nr:dephospho-CoA kinase [Prevotella sp.]
MKTGITGGIGSGKSYVCKLLAERGITVYDCDSAAKRLMRTSADLRQQLMSLIGPDAYLPVVSHSAGQDKWQLNKAAVAQFLLASEANAHAIDAVVHPAVFRDFEESGLQWMESAILFESGINRLVDCVIAVTAPEEIRIQRIMQRDGISREKAKEWMGRQWPQEEVRRRADFEIINDGTTDLNQQINLILEQCNKQF